MLFQFLRDCSFISVSACLRGVVKEIWFFKTFNTKFGDVTVRTVKYFFRLISIVIDAWPERKEMMVKLEVAHKPFCQGRLSLGKADVSTTFADYESSTVVLLLLLVHGVNARFKRSCFVFNLFYSSEWQMILETQTSQFNLCSRAHHARTSHAHITQLTRGRYFDVER